MNPNLEKAIQQAMAELDRVAWDQKGCSVLSETYKLLCTTEWGVLSPRTRNILISFFWNIFETFFG